MDELVNRSNAPCQCSGCIVTTVDFSLAQPQDRPLHGPPLHTYQKKKRSFQQGPAINFDTIRDLGFVKFLLLRLKALPFIQHVSVIKCFNSCYSFNHLSIKNQNIYKLIFESLF